MEHTNSWGLNIMYIHAALLEHQERLVVVDKNIYIYIYIYAC